MITGKFESAVGLVTISIDNNGDDYDMSIVGLGNLQYNFDVTPESVTIDRMLALYSNIRVEANEINRLGDNIYDIVYEATLNADGRKIPASVVIDTHDLENYVFNFDLNVENISFNEKSHVVSFNFKPRTKDVTFKDVFDDIPDENKAPYDMPAVILDENLAADPTSIVQIERDFVATGVMSWIKAALNKIFDNDFENEVRSTKVNEALYSKDVYDEIEKTNAPDPTDISTKKLLTLVDMGSEFVPIEEGAKEEKIFPGGLLTMRLIDSNTFPGDDFVIVKGQKVKLFSAESNGLGPTIGGFSKIKVNDRIFRFVGTSTDPANTRRIGIVTKIISNTEAEAVITTSFAFFFENRGWFAIRSEGPNQRPALDVFKEIAGIEGSIFGTGFSRNFYFNRFSEDADRPILDYKKVNDMSPIRSNLFLGASSVRQLSTIQVPARKQEKKRKSFIDRLFGRRRRYNTVIEEIPEDPYGVYPTSDIDEDGEPNLPFINRFSFPVMSRYQSFTPGNTKATKELLIEQAPAYPLMSRGQYLFSNERFIGRYANYLEDDVLERALTSAGLRSYFRALTSEKSDLRIDFEIQGAFSVKPWQLFQFETTLDTPERYRGRVFRVSEISYSLVNDTARIKAYQIDDFDFEPVTEPPELVSLTVEPTFQRIEFIPIEGAEGRFSVVATGSSNPVTVKINNTNVPGGFQVSSDNVNFSDELVLNPDGNGRVSSTIFVRFGRGAIEVAEQEPRVDIRVEQSDASQRVLISVDILEVSPENTAGLTTSAIGGSVTSIPVDMFTEVERGQDLLLVGGGRQYSITVDQDVVPTGRSNMAIEEQFVEDGLYAIRQSQSALQTGITVTDRQIVLKAVGDTGRIASVRLDAEAEEQSVINIDADTVNIVGVELKRSDTNLANNVGYIQSGNFEAGTTGWRIDGNGDAEFSNVTVRGQLGASNIVGTIKMLSGNIESSETTSIGPVYTLSNSSFRFRGVVGNDQKFTNVNSSGYEARIIDSVNPGVGASIVRITPDEIRFGSTQSLVSTGIHDNLKVVKEFDPTSQGGGGDIVRMSLENNSSFKVVDAADANSVDIEKGKLSISNATGEKIAVGVDTQGLPSINMPDDAEFRFYSGATGYPFSGGQVVWSVDDDAFAAKFFTSLETASTMTSTSFRGGDIRTSNGSASFPAYRFASDLDTGMYRVGADHLGFSTNGTARLEIKSDGDVEAKNDIRAVGRVLAKALNLETIALADISSYEVEGTMIILDDPGISTDLRVYSNGAWRIIHSW